MSDSLTHLYVILFAYGTISLAVTLLILRQTFDRTVLATKFSSNARHSSQPGGRGGASVAGSGSTYTAKLPLSPGSSRPFSPPFTPPSSEYYHGPGSTYTPGRGEFELDSPDGRRGMRGSERGEATDPRPLLDVPRGYAGGYAGAGPELEGARGGGGRMVEEFGEEAGSHASWQSGGLPPGARRD